jgi:hypothetical protein
MKTVLCVTLQQMIVQDRENNCHIITTQYKNTIDETLNSVVNMISCFQFLWKRVEWWWNLFSFGSHSSTYPYIDELKFLLRVEISKMKTS